MLAQGQGRKPARDLVRVTKALYPPLPFTQGGRYMEVIQMLTSLIQNVGFPIACVIAMFHFWNKEREDHKSELAAVTDALNNNTLVLQSIRDHLMQK